jgi:hypothetical protein
VAELAGQPVGAVEALLLMVQLVGVAGQVKVESVATRASELAVAVPRRTVRWEITEGLPPRCFLAAAPSQPVLYSFSSLLGWWRGDDCWGRTS